MTTTRCIKHACTYVMAGSEVAGSLKCIASVETSLRQDFTVCTATSSKVLTSLHKSKRPNKK